MQMFMLMLQLYKQCNNS